MNTISCIYNKSYTLKANAFTKTGYTFKGWNTRANGTGKYSYSNKATVKNATSIAGKTITLYAQWTLKKYTITYQLDGGTNNGSNPTSYKITNSTITLKNPTKTGYTFVGWYTDSSYKTKVTKIPKGSTGNKTFYAKWKPITYTICYDKNGATEGSVNKKTCSYNSTVTLATGGITKNGYVLAGWSKTKNGAITYKRGQTVKNLTSKNGRQVTLYAVWQKKLSKHQNPNFGTHNTSVRQGSIQYIVIHYTGMPNDAKDWITLFNQPSHTRSSADYFIGYNGDIWQYNPYPEERYCWSVGGARQNTKGGSLYGKASNSNCINIEMCVNISPTLKQLPNIRGWILKNATLNKTVSLTKELMLEYNIPASRVIRHYDVTGKLCPGIIGWNEDSGSTIEWRNFKKRISE